MKELDKSLVVNAFGDVYYNFTSEWLRNLIEKHLKPSSKEEAIAMTKDISWFDEPVEKIEPLWILKLDTDLKIIKKINEIIFYLNRLDGRKN
jgi:hypothetical protein